MPILRILLLLVLLILPSLSSLAGTRAKSLKIIVEPLGDATFNVAVRFRGDSDGSTTLDLPGEWGGQSHLYNAIQDLRVHNASLSDSGQPHIKTLQHDPGVEIIVTYRLVQDFQGPFKNAVRYRPVAAADHIHWIGQTVFAMPAWKEEDSVDLEFQWKNFPDSWTIANSFGVNNRTQKAKTTVGDLLSGLFVAGDYRITRISAAGEPIVVAIRDKWNFSDAALADMIGRVVGGQREFWKDRTQKRFLVSLTAWDEGPGSSSFGGTGLTDAFALFATPDANIPGLRGLLSHEYSHNWIPNRLGKMPEPEQSLYWFSEGFNEFYTYRQLIKSGIISRQELLDLYNSHIREYYMLPTRNDSNDRIVSDFWKDPSVGRLPYLRGFLFATNLDAMIRRGSDGKRSLDDPMFDLYTASREGNSATLSLEHLARVFGRYLGTDPAPLMKRQLIEGDLIEPAADALGDDVTMALVPMDIFELGFDFEKFAKERIVSGVKPESAAFEAGLRNGQQRNGGVSVHFGDTTREIELMVGDDGVEKTVKYRPVAKEQAKVPQYKLK